MSLLSHSQSSSLSFPCEPALPYEILTDYDSYAEWMPFVSRSKLLAREGDLAIAEFELLQPGKDKFAVECIHTRNKMVLIRTISGEFPVDQFEWKIEPGAEGCKVTLTIERKATWNQFVPSSRNPANPENLLKALQSQISVFSPDIGIQGEGGEKILEFTETEQGIICWFRGKKYTLTPVPGDENA